VYQRILIPIDGSICSQQAVSQGLELAKVLGAEVTFLHALENPLKTVYAMPETVSYQPQLYQDLKHGAQESLDTACSQAANLGVEASALLIENSEPVQAIHEAEADHDLVVMGTHGRRGFNRWMFGSVAEGALRRSEKPFLLVRSEAETGAA
jgi:nucleotide-binding universal stress UspA family protein